MNPDDAELWADVRRRRSLGTVLRRTAVFGGIAVILGVSVAAMQLSGLDAAPTGSRAAMTAAPAMPGAQLVWRSGDAANPDTDQGATATDGAAQGQVVAGASTRRIDGAWAARIAAATGIPTRALTAYASAELVLADEAPGCGIGWNTLAAIGSIESDHGRHGGAVLGDDGYSTPRIRGVELNGDGVAAIAGGGAAGEDASWDRAAGPMQFIASTWATWGADASGDGLADPDQIDDAALTAARYLCAGGTVTTVAGWRAAVFSYNHLDSYVDAVAASANDYARASASGG